MLSRGHIAYDDVAEEDKEYWDKSQQIKVNNKEGNCKNSEDDGMEKEGKVTTGEIDILLDSIHVPNLPNVNIEDIDLNCRADDIQNGE